MSSSFHNPSLRFAFLQQIKQTTRLSGVLLFITSSLSSLAQPNTWVQKSDLGYSAANVPEPTARSAAAGFSIGSKGYVGTGYDGTADTDTKDFWEYDPARNAWTQKADFGGTARYGAVGFSIGSKGYLGTGIRGGDYYEDFWEYDPASNTWTRKADFGGIGRREAVGFSIGSKGYLGTGIRRNKYYKDFWEYDPSVNAWIQKADFAGTSRYGAIGFSIGGKGYLGTGYDGSYTKDFWEYDPVLNMWTKKTDFGGTALYSGVGFSIGTKGYIGTGYNENSDNSKTFWEYDPASNKWTRKADFKGTPRFAAIAFSIGSKGYIGMGVSYYDSGYYYHKDLWEYIDAENSWSQKTSDEVTARFDAVGFSIGSKGYIGTGYDNIYPYSKKDFWEYDPVSNTWTQKADFGGTARSGAVGFSIDGKGYIGTGSDDIFPYYKKDFWEYDPVANAWTQKADFGGTARRDAVGFNIEDKGWIGTGLSWNGSLYNYEKDFWEYDPVADTWTRKADFGGVGRSSAAGFSIGSKGYIGTGFNAGPYSDFWEYNPVADTWTRIADFGGVARSNAAGFSISSKGYLGTGVGLFYGDDWKDFWEYDPVSNTWTRKANFGGISRREAIGFSIGSKGYFGTGRSETRYFKDFWEYTPNGCPSPFNLRVPKISDTCARLNWNVPDSSVEHIKVSYRPVGNTIWMEDRKKSPENSKWICGLTPNTTYEWKVRNICADEKTGWIKGPNFTTLPTTGFASNARAANAIKGQGNINAQIIPNPTRGNFTVQMYLLGKTALTTLSFYNNLGEKIWQQDAGRLTGSASIQIALENKLPPGLYVIMIQRGNERIIQKVMVIK